jgi:hypothetical protein
MKFRRRRPTAAPAPREHCGFLWPQSTLDDYEVKEIGGHRFVRLIRRAATANGDAAKASTGYEFRRIAPRASQPRGYDLKELSEREIAELMAPTSGAEDSGEGQVTDQHVEGTDDNDVPSAETIYLDDEDVEELSALDLKGMLPQRT